MLVSVLGSWLIATSLGNKMGLSKKVIIQIMFLLLVPIYSFSQSLEWMIYNVENSELPSNYINCMTFNSENELWIGTTNGLAKYKSNNLEIFNTSNSDIPGNWINCINIDQKGILWLGSSILDGFEFYAQGLTKFDGINWTIFRTYNSDLPAPDVNTIFIDSNNSKWIGTWCGGTAVYDDVDWKIFNKENTNWRSDCIYSISEDYYGNICVGSNHSLSIYDGESWQELDTSNTELPNNYGIRSVVPLDSSSNWLGTWGGGLVYLENGQTVIYDTSNSRLPDNFISTIVVDNEENLWIGTHFGGLAKFNGTDWSIYDTSNSKLPENEIWSIVIDNNGNKWVGTKNGLAVFNESGIVLSVDRKEIVSANYNLSQNYPNPFNPTTTISFKVPTSSKIRLSIYDVSGNLINVIVDKEFVPGYYDIKFNGSNLSSGVYLYQLETPDCRESKKMILLK